MSLPIEKTVGAQFHQDEIGPVVMEKPAKFPIALRIAVKGSQQLKPLGAGPTMRSLVFSRCCGRGCHRGVHRVPAFPLAMMGWSSSKWLRCR